MNEDHKRFAVTFMTWLVVGIIALILILIAAVIGLLILQAFGTLYALLF